MLDFYYDVIKTKYPEDKSTLLFTDTDSLMISIETENIYDDMREEHEQFDLSNYPDDHQIFKNDTPETIKWLKQKNKKRVGKFKNEAGGEPILEFVGLRAKAYAYLLETYDCESNEFIIEQSKTSRGLRRTL